MKIRHSRVPGTTYQIQGQGKNLEKKAPLN